jgi:hypothetical protein
MKGKVLFVAGLAVGYVLGTRAGRQRYEQIKGAWLKVWNTPALQKQVHKGQDYAAQKIGEAPAALADGASKLFSTIAASRREAAERAKEAASTASAQAQQAAHTVADTVTDAAGDAKDAVQDTVSDAKDAAKASDKPKSSTRTRTSTPKAGGSDASAPSPDL